MALFVISSFHMALFRPFLLLFFVFFFLSHGVISSFCHNAITLGKKTKQITKWHTTEIEVHLSDQSRSSDDFL